ncbi:MAG: hypothetical protein Ct9H300mP32_3210 [Verrucomicrobiota bacterium]|nr:MAG: hypothetical protein Ct9H300mP32_3210 [Verrucomicrobiota bacterium]
MKGFGVTLTVGICASMFTALVVTRLIFDLFRNFGRPGCASNSQTQLHGLAKYAFVASWILVAIGIGKASKRGDAMGVDFKGGDQITLEFTAKKTTVNCARDWPKQSDPVPGCKRGENRGLQVTVGFGKGEQAYKTLTEKLPTQSLRRSASCDRPESVRDTSGARSLLIALFAILV